MRSKKLFGHGVLLVVLGAAGGGCADQDPAEVPREPAHKEDSAGSVSADARVPEFIPVDADRDTVGAVAVLLHDFREFVQAGDAAALPDLCTDDVVFVGTAGETADGIDEAVALWAAEFEQVTYVDFSWSQVVIIGSGPVVQVTAPLPTVELRIGDRSVTVEGLVWSLRLLETESTMRVDASVLVDPAAAK